MSNKIIYVGDIVEQFLIENGYDGLYNSSEECGCLIGDLFPCNSPCEDCTASWKKEESSDDFGWIVCWEKPKKVEEKE